MQKVENNIFTVDVSHGKENYSQRNNQYKHYNSDGGLDVYSSTMCNVTAICMSLDYNGWRFPVGQYTQPEDNLADFIMKSTEVDSYYKSKMPALYNEYKNNVSGYYTPNEIHACLALGANLWLGVKDADTFSENATLIQIQNELLEDRSCVLSGRFVLPNGKVLNHIVSLVGAIWNFTSAKDVAACVQYVKEKSVLPNSYIIDDPYGDFRKNYESGYSGNNIELTRSEFISIFKPVDNASVKYCHFLKSGAPVV